MDSESGGASRVAPSEPPPMSDEPVPDRDAVAIERVSPLDLAMRSMNAARVREQLGVILRLDGAEIGLAAVRQAIGERLPAVPRLRQHVVSLPPGCGRPIWLDDPTFDLDWHVTELTCPPSADDGVLLEMAAAIATRPLPSVRPLWRVTLVSGLPERKQALIVVLHHTLADGLGALAAAMCLLEPGQIAPARAAPFPRPRPSTRRLFLESARAKARAAGQAPAFLRELRASTGPLGGLGGTRAAPCSLLHATGPRRRFAVVTADLGALRAAAASLHATLNEALLSAVAGALRSVLSQRGEGIDTLRIMVPVATRTTSDGRSLGNEVSPVIVGVPMWPDRVERLRALAASFRRARTLVAGQPMIALLGPVFRVLASLRLYRTLIRHQHRCHTEVSTVRGPDQPIAFGETTVTSVVPFSVGEVGSMTVKFVALSYAGALVVTVVADPELVPDLDLLTASLGVELESLTRLHRQRDNAEAWHDPSGPTGVDVRGA